MNNIEYKLSQLKDKLESTAFLVSKNGSEKQVHSEIVRSLVILSEVLQLVAMGNNSQDKTIYSSDKKNIQFLMQQIVTKLTKYVIDLSYGQNIKTKLIQKY
jgi:hypothetical protein